MIIWHIRKKYGSKEINRFPFAGKNKYIIKDPDAQTQSRQTCEKSQLVMKIADADMRG